MPVSSGPNPDGESDFSQQVEKLLAEVTSKFPHGEAPRGMILLGDSGGFVFRIIGPLPDAIGAVVTALAKNQAAFAFVMASIRAAEALRSILPQDEEAG